MSLNSVGSPFARRDRLKWLATPKGMATAALTQKQRRGGTDHRMVIGSFRMRDRRVTLYAVECGPSFDIPRPIRLTSDSARWNRWRTRQAASEFVKRWTIPNVHVIDLDWIDVLDMLADPPCHDGKAATSHSRLPLDQRAGGAVAEAS